MRHVLDSGMLSDHNVRGADVADATGSFGCGRPNNICQENLETRTKSPGADDVCSGPGDLGCVGGRNRCFESPGQLGECVVETRVQGEFSSR